MDNQPLLSVIVPVLNEQDNLIPLHNELMRVLINMEVSYEIIFVDDGSTDNSFQELTKIHENNKATRIIQFRRNFGQSAAFAAGFDTAKGELILTIDADGQNDPNDIPKMLI